jgi:hypothetical protein
MNSNLKEFQLYFHLHLHQDVIYDHPLHTHHDRFHLLNHMENPLGRTLILRSDIMFCEA